MSNHRRVVADHCEACWHVSCQTADVLIGSSPIPHAATASTSTQTKDQTNQHPPVKRSNSDPEIASMATQGFTPGLVGELPALIAYVIYSPVYSLSWPTVGRSVIGYVGCGKTTVRTICLTYFQTPTIATVVRKQR